MASSSLDLKKLLGLQANWQKKMGKEDAGFFYQFILFVAATLHFLYTFYCLSILTAHFIYISCFLLAWIELLSKGDFKDVNVT